MNKIRYSNAIIDMLFFLLPFIILFIIKCMKNDLSGMLRTSDYSLATAIMYGQLLGKSLKVKDAYKQEGRFQLFQILTFIFSLVSIVIYVGLQLIDLISNFIYILQLIMFPFSLFFYVPILTLLNDITNDT